MVIRRAAFGTPFHYAPYPFSNADPEDLAGEETFDFEVGGTSFHCEVKTKFFTCGAGFAKVDVRPSSSASWNYQVEFSGEYDVQTFQSTDDAPWA